MAGYSVVGKRLPRQDSVAKATGQGRYTNDLALPRMLHGKMLRSPHPHARILHVDTSRAERLPGVKAVVTGKDTAGVKYGVMGATRDQYALPMEKVRYPGEEVAAVAAVDEDTAEEALGLIRVEYQVLPAVFDPEHAMREGAPLLHETKERNISAAFHVTYGDVAEAFAKADYVREDRFETAPIAHCQMEPYAVVAEWDTLGRLQAWMPNQSPFIKQKTLSSTLKVPQGDVTVGRVLMGGAFGGRSEFFAAEFCAALLARKAGRPVKMVYSREENFTATRQKHPFIIRLKTGVARDGVLLAREYRVVADGGAYGSTAIFLFANSLMQLLALYRLPAFRFEGYRVYTNNPVRGAMKGHGNQQLRFADECQMDLIAQELGMDPLELRLKNAVQPGDVLPNRARVFSCGLTECLTEASRRDGWEARRLPNPDSGERGAGGVEDGPGFKKKRALASGNSLTGLGLGCAPFISGFSYGYRTGSAAFVKFNESGQAVVITGLVDNGQGNELMAAQIAAEEMGVAPEDVRVLWGDTAEAPLDPGSHSMTSTFVSGNAVKAAAADARRQLLEIAADEMEANPADLEIQGGRVSVKGSPEGGLSLRTVVTGGLGKGRFVLGRGSYMPPVDQVDFSQGTIDGQVTGAYTYGAAVAEVQVDPETGQVSVARVAAAQDCGTAINPLLVEGQIQGSVAFSCGQALSEGLSLAEGVTMNPGFRDYGLPTALDVPAVEPLIVEPGDPHGPFGAKEAAEALGVAVIPAIANGVYRATGARVEAMPITPERVLQALRRKATQACTWR